MKIQVEYNNLNAVNSLEYASENERKEEWVKRYLFNLNSLGDIVSKQKGVVHIDFTNNKSELEYHPDVKLIGFSNTAIQLIDWIAM